MSVKSEVSDWLKFFGHLRILGNQNFNETNFPLEPEGRVRRVIPKWFSDTATGHERLHWAESQGFELPGLRATGLYLLAHPKLLLERPVVGGGGSSECVPVFRQFVGPPFVVLFRLDDDFSPLCVWIFSPK